MIRSMTIAVSVVAGLAVAACSDDEDSFSLTGDWFFCETSQCAALRSAGIRFKQDNAWTELSADGDHLEAAETYCLQPGEFKSGTYKLEGLILKIKGRSCGSIVADGAIRVEGDVIIFVDTGKAMKRIKPSRLSGTCQGNVQPLDGAPDQAADAGSREG